MPEYTTLIFTSEFVASFSSNQFSAAERKRLARALDLLDINERLPSLRLHALQGDMAGKWSASASDSLRITFERVAEGKKRLTACSRHYQ